LFHQQVKQDKQSEQEYEIQLKNNLTN